VLVVGCRTTDCFLPHIKRSSCVCVPPTLGIRSGTKPILIVFTSPLALGGLARRKSRVSERPTSGRRHLRRASSEFLDAGGTLFDPFIGQMLRERYALLQHVPQDMQRLLTNLINRELSRCRSYVSGTGRAVSKAS
jgi:hypothetical protein